MCLEKNHSIFIKRCLELAKNGAGKAAPNPQVGSVIVHKGKIIGEGWHREYGKPHAEVNAINSVKDKSLLKESTIYVNLEPCSHFGKTPPCSDLIIEVGIPHVVIGSIDYYHRVAGKGIEKLEKAGIKVEVGICEEECKKINKDFFTRVEKARPYIYLKWAQSSDGFIDANSDFNKKGISISSKTSSRYTHKLRSKLEAIMVGTNTAIIDNPMLDARNWDNNNPIRVVIDKELKIPKSHKLFNTQIPTIVFNQEVDKKEEYLEYIKIDFNNCVTQILEKLNEKKIQSILIEGGAKLHKSFIEENAWDEAIITTSNQIFGSGIAAAKLKGQVVGEVSIENNKIIQIKNRK